MTDEDKERLDKLEKRIKVLEDRPDWWEEYFKLVDKNKREIGLK